LSDTPELVIDPTILAPLTWRRLRRGQSRHTTFPNGAAGASNVKPGEPVVQNGHGFAASRTRP